MAEKEKTKFSTKEEKQAFWHATSHVLADAVKRIWPETKLGIGPAIEEGFYYDFDHVPFIPADIEKIEKAMHDIVKENSEFKQVFLERKKAEKQLEKESYKLELLEEIPDKKVSFFQHGEFLDLCAGPLINRTGEIKSFKLLNTAAAYWRGDSSQPILQRIYGISFPSQKELDEFLKQKEEAAARDHVKLGKQLDLFEIYPDVGAGLIIWHPKGSIIRGVIEDFWKKEHQKKGYYYVYTPHIGKIGLWKQSGHWDFYKDSLYPPMQIDTEQFLI